MASTTEPLEDSIYAVLGNLLPSLAPGAALAGDSAEVVLPVDGGRARVSTESLLVASKGEPRSRWPHLVEEWLRDVMQQVSSGATNATPVDPTRLRLQAVPRGASEPAGLSVAFGSSFDLLVVEDRDGSIRRLQQTGLNALGLSLEAAASAALDATISEVLIGLDVQDHPLPGGGSVRMASADGVPYVSAGITSIKQLAGQDLPHGAFVGVPQHSALLLFPVKTAASLDVVPVLDQLVRSMYDASADPCTAGIYWFVGDDAHLIGVQVGANGQPRVKLPPELRAVVNTLPGAGSQLTGP